MLNPDTAAAGESVWDVIPRSEFEKNVADLMLENDLPATSQVYKLLLEQSHPGSALLPLDVEREFVDDVAFIAACEEGVNTVTAATVEVMSDLTRVVLAANEGIKLRVQSAMMKLLLKLEACARLELPRDLCATQILGIVVGLNHNRIYGRLGSRKYLQPSYRRGPAMQPLIEDLRRLCRGIQAKKPYDPVQRKALLSELDDFHHAFHEMEVLPAFEDSDAIISLLEQAFKITSPSVSFLSRLKSSGFTESCLQHKQIRQLMKLANYRRVCYGLAEKARSLRSIFTSLELQVLEPFGASFWQGKKRFVHAEIQILTRYVKTEIHPRPRVIGASKEACFLCDSFVRAHGELQISKAHRQLYDKWTIPDLIEYDSLSRERLQNTLKVVNRDIKRERAAERRGRHRRPYPLQSSVNLLTAAVRQASMSTIRSTRPSPKGSVASFQPGSTFTQGMVSIQPSQYLVYNHVSRAASGQSVRNNERPSQGIPQSAEGEAPKELHEIEPTATASLHLNNLTNRFANLSHSGSAPVVSQVSSLSNIRRERHRLEANVSPASQPAAEHSMTLGHRISQVLDHGRLPAPARQVRTALPTDRCNQESTGRVPNQRKRHRQRRDHRYPIKFAKDPSPHQDADIHNKKLVRQATYESVKTRTRHDHNLSQEKSSRTRAHRKQKRRKERSYKPKKRRHNIKRLVTLLDICIRAVSCIPRGRSSFVNRDRSRGL